MSPGNPGNGHTLRVGFSNSERSWSESVNVVQILAGVLHSVGHEAILESDWLELPSGLTLRPQVVDFKPQHPSGAQTTSTIQVGHKGFPAPGFFEYQHSTGSSLEDSFGKGFASWAEYDLPAILDSLRVSPDTCTAIGMTVEEVQRRVVLGPPMHMARDARPDLEADHPFCPCCFVTKSFEVFRPFLESTSVFAVRLFAMRSADGALDADCRVNGEDFEAGKQALLRYVKTWPDRGFELRKQLVIFQTTPGIDT